MKLIKVLLVSFIAITNLVIISSIKTYKIKCNKLNDNGNEKGKGGGGFSTYSYPSGTSKKGSITLWKTSSGGGGGSSSYSSSSSSGGSGGGVGGAVQAVNSNGCGEFTFKNKFNIAVGNEGQMPDGTPVLPPH